MPARPVLASFEPITADNGRIVSQEWLAGAFTMWGIAPTVIAATAAPGAWLLQNLAIVVQLSGC